jgi:hypothetical protein
LGVFLFEATRLLNARQRGGNHPQAFTFRALQQVGIPNPRLVQEHVATGALQARNRFFLTAGGGAAVGTESGAEEHQAKAAGQATVANRAPQCSHFEDSVEMEAPHIGHFKVVTGSL